MAAPAHLDVRAPRPPSQPPRAAGEPPAPRDAPGTALAATAPKPASTSLALPSREAQQPEKDSLELYASALRNMHLEQYDARQRDRQARVQQLEDKLALQGQ